MYGSLEFSPFRGIYENMDTFSIHYSYLNFMETIKLKDAYNTAAVCNNAQKKDLFPQQNSSFCRITACRIRLFL